MVTFYEWVDPLKRQKKKKILRRTLFFFHIDLKEVLGGIKKLLIYKCSEKLVCRGISHTFQTSIVEVATPPHFKNRVWIELPIYFFSHSPQPIQSFYKPIPDARVTYPFIKNIRSLL